MTMMLMYFRLLADITSATPIPILTGFTSPIGNHTFLTTDEANCSRFWNFVEDF
jgi:hypothetical protein